MHRLLATAALLTLMLSPLAHAADEQRPDPEQRIEQMATRLDLTDEQIDQVTPVLQDSMERQRSILSSYGIDLDSPDAQPGKLGMRKARAMRKELDAVRTDTLDELELILSDEQLAEFERIQEERRTEMRERIRGGR